MELPGIQEFLELVQIYERDHEITECVYRGVLDKFKTISLCDLSKEHTQHLLQPFFLTWGVMTRVLGYVGCEKISAKISGMSVRLDDFREKELIAEDLEKIDKTIATAYEEIKNVNWTNKNGRKKTVGSTAAAKTLHLIAPNLFMMWDRDIRKVYTFKESGEEYVRFLLSMQKWYGKLEPTLTKLQKQYKKSGTKLLDEYNWIKARQL